MLELFITKGIMLYSLLAPILTLVCIYKILDDNDNSNIYKKISIGLIFSFIMCIGILAYISKTYPTHHTSHINNKLIGVTINENKKESRWLKWHYHHT